jgi:hypothetical protein
MIDTEYIAAHDQCPRLATWGAAYEFPRINLTDAMYKALRAGLESGIPSAAKDALITCASRPGLDITARNIFDIAMHHAAMMEVICAYLIGSDGPWKPSDAIYGLPIDFQPLSYQMDDGRLRRVVLCSSWNALREEEELNSWRTVADTCTTGRPMLINAIVIGSSRKGFRPSPWTEAYIHPENGIKRVKKREGRFTENWKRVYRESTDDGPNEWLRLMQQDGAFEDLVRCVTADVPLRRNEYLSDMVKITGEIEEKRETMRRSGCFRYSPCGFSKLCNHSVLVTPEMAKWKRRVVV